MTGVPPLDLSRAEFRNVLCDLRYLRSRGHQAHPMNFPGPIYGTSENLMGCAPLEYLQPGLILVAEDMEFLWRQPLDLREQVLTLEAICSDESASYGIDGDSWWSTSAVTAWRSARMPLVLAWAKSNLTGVEIAKASGGAITADVAACRVARLIEYYQTSAWRDLEAYASRLER